MSHHLTYEDVERAREGNNDRVELIEGELFVTPAPSLPHQDLLAELYSAFRESVFKPGLGRVYFAPVDVRFAINTIVQPDLVVVLDERKRTRTRPRIDGTPSLALEVISSSTSRYDTEIKSGDYARYGVPEYWLVDPDARTITICSDPREGRYLVESVARNVAVSATIPGLSVVVLTVFAIALDEWEPNGEEPG